MVSICFLNDKNKGRFIVVDHVNNDKLDNRVENLQLITNRENLSKDKKNKTSKYTGVSWCKLTKKWKSSIQINKKTRYLGLYNSEEEAHLEYQNKLKELNI